MESHKRAVAANTRRLRDARRLSLDALAAASGVGRATLARLEAGQANPTLETLYAIADALNVALGELLADGSAAPIHVVRASEAIRVPGAIDAAMLDRLHGVGYAELFTLAFTPGRRRTAAPHPQGVTEHLLVTAGRVEAGPTHHTVILDAGDYLRFPGDVEHVYAGLDAPAAAVVVMTYPVP